MRCSNIVGELSKKLINKALSYQNKNIKGILEEYPDGLVPTGQKKNGKEVTDYYYNVYAWVSETEYKEWRDWALLEVIKEGHTAESLDWWECLYGLKEGFLPFYKKEGQLL